MHLSLALFKSAGGRGRLAQGRIWIGKHRIAHHIYPWTMQRIIKRINVEEQNLFYLRHPYLTVEQERGHAKELQKHETWLKGRKIYDAATKIPVSVRMEDRLGRLNGTNKWEL